MKKGENTLVMSSLEERKRNLKIFSDEVLPKASCASSWTVVKAEKAFKWALYCRNFKEMKRAPLLLLEEFLRNPHLTEEAFVNVMRAAAKVFSPEELQCILQDAIDRKAIYHNTVQLVQQSESVNVVKASILKQNVATNGSTIYPLLQSTYSLELLLESPDETVDRSIHQALETALKDWLDRGTRPNILAALLAVPIRLSRAAFLKSPKLLEHWLDCLGQLAGRFEAIYYNDGEHCWNWPDEDESAGRFRGIRFSFDQLVRHFQSLFSGKDCVKTKADQYLALAHCWPVCSVFLEVQQRLN